MFVEYSGKMNTPKYASAIHYQDATKADGINLFEQ